IGGGLKEEVTVQSGITVVELVELSKELEIKHTGTEFRVLIRPPVTVSAPLTVESAAASKAVIETQDNSDPLNSLPNLNNDLSNRLRVAAGALAVNQEALGKIVIDGKGKEQQTLRLDGLDITPLTDLPAGDPALGVLDALLKPSVALQGSKTDTLTGALA